MSTRRDWRGGCNASLLDLGVRIHEHTKVDGLERDGKVMKLTAPFGRVLAREGRPWYQRVPRRWCGPSAGFIVPVYDYVLMTEPLTDEQMASIGWSGRQGLGDIGQPVPLLPADRRQPHPVRRLRRRLPLRRRKVSPALEERPETFATLSPPTSSRPSRSSRASASARVGRRDRHVQPFCAFFGSAHGSRVAYAAGFTGLGVAATRFGAEVMLDLLEGRETERTRTRVGAAQAASLPARALAVRRDSAHPLVAPAGRPQRGQA